MKGARRAPYEVEQESEPGMRRGLFVTGTDTAVGKTAVACALARRLVEQGVSVKVRKPVESGCHREEGRLVPADARLLKIAARSDEPLEVICPYPLEAPLSPERAARLAGVALSLDKLKTACLAGVGEKDFLLVEGAGGFLSPLAPGARVAELAAALRLPVLLVAADRLGCLNHVLLTAEAIAARGLTLSAVILNRLTPAHEAGMDNAADLARWLGCSIVTLPYAAELSTPWESWRQSLSGLAV
jgi:dethiobiotin synthetase